MCPRSGAGAHEVDHCGGRTRRDRAERRTHARDIDRELAAWTHLLGRRARAATRVEHPRGRCCVKVATVVERPVVVPTGDIGDQVDGAGRRCRAKPCRPRPCEPSRGSGRASPGLRLRLDALGRSVPLGHTVTNPKLLGNTYVTLSTTADTPLDGTSALPPTWRSIVLPAPTFARGAPVPSTCVEQARRGYRVVRALRSRKRLVELDQRKLTLDVLNDPAGRLQQLLDLPDGGVVTVSRSRPAS